MLAHHHLGNRPDVTLVEQPYLKGRHIVGIAEANGLRDTHPALAQKFTHRRLDAEGLVVGILTQLVRRKKVSQRRLAHTFPVLGGRGDLHPSNLCRHRFLSRALPHRHTEPDPTQHQHQQHAKKDQTGHAQPVKQAWLGSRFRDRGCLARKGDAQDHRQILDRLNFVRLVLGLVHGDRTGHGLLFLLRCP